MRLSLAPAPHASKRTCSHFDGSRCRRLHCVMSSRAHGKKTPSLVCGELVDFNKYYPVTFMGCALRRCRELRMNDLVSKIAYALMCISEEFDRSRHTVDYGQNRVELIQSQRTRLLHAAACEHYVIAPVVNWFVNAPSVLCSACAGILQTL